jgi:hypothetical protein
MGKYTGTGVGGFRYSHEPEGPIAGEVGTGLTDEVRKDMHENPDSYLGRIARVSYQNKKPSGALFAPSYISLHEDEPGGSVVPPQLGMTHNITRGKRIASGLNAIEQVAPATSKLKQLLQAKQESDRSNYHAKNDILRKMMTEAPHEFMIDSELPGGIVGLTHKPTNFRIHTQRKALPTEFIAYQTNQASPSIAA